MTERVVFFRLGGFFRGGILLAAHAFGLGSRFLGGFLEGGCFLVAHALRQTIAVGSLQNIGENILAAFQIVENMQHAQDRTD